MGGGRNITGSVNAARATENSVSIQCSIVGNTVNIVFVSWVCPYNTLHECSATALHLAHNSTSYRYVGAVSTAAVRHVSVVEVVLSGQTCRTSGSGSGTGVLVPL